MASNFPEDYPNSSAADWIFHQLKKFAQEGKIAQIFADDASSWTYQELLEKSIQVASGLRSMGINSGDMVSFVTRNSHELYAIALGFLMSGVLITPSIAELLPHDLRQNFVMIKPKFVIAGAPSMAAVAEAIDGEEELDPKPLIFEVKHFFRECIAKGRSSNPATFQPVYVPDPKSHVFSCMFSSGTTGKQKAVSMTDRGMLRAMHFASQFQKTGNGRAFTPSQPNWISWWFIIFRSLFRGWTRIFTDKSDSLRILDAIQNFQVSVLFCAPSLVANMAYEMEENPGRWDLSSLTTVLAAGDMMNKHAHERLYTKLNLNIYQEYGSTEAGAIIQGRTDLPVVCGSIGRPVVPVKLVDVATGEEIKEPNKPGEVLVQWYIIKDYVNNPEATANSFDKHGWFKMGDIAVFDESGNYFMVDRAKEMFKYCGFQIAPSELEDIIMKIPGVKDTAVVGKYAGVAVGEVPTAFVVKTSGSDITEQDIHDYLKHEKVHDSMKLRGGVIFTSEIPRNTNGKILRARLRSLLKKF